MNRDLTLRVLDSVCTRLEQAGARTQLAAIEGMSDDELLVLAELEARSLTFAPCPASLDGLLA